ncbi:uncharacterized protein [Mytilus edulis]|uniref:uncharacterized protein n=1 Tax=Mytilus edulis TaxID=6550 RepID=UPI0039EF9BB8
MTEPAEDRPLKRTIPPDLQRLVEDIQIKIPRTTEVVKEVTVALIKPDAVEAGKVDQILEDIKAAGIEILKHEERKLTEDEVRQFYSHLQDQDFFEDLVKFMTSGPSHVLALTKGKTGENIIDEFRDLIGPTDVEEAKTQKPESLRAKHGQQTFMNALHGSSSADMATRELAFFFPDFVTLALVRPEAFRLHKDEIISKIRESGFKVAMQKEMQLTKEMAEEFYKEHTGQEYFDQLVTNMSSGPVLALALAREDAIEGWRSMLGPKEVDKAKEEAPESLRAKFAVDDAINSLHGSDSEDTAKKELDFFFPMEQTVAVIKPDAEGTKGPPGDLDEEKKRWLIVGICLHSIISPLLRKYADPILRNLYNSLVSSDTIDTQGYNRYLRKYPASNRYFLNYDSINNNNSVPKKKIYNKWINDYQNFDYKVASHVDLSKLFLQPNMAHYSGFNESCDSSALLGLVINISSFPPIIQTDAEKMRSDIRNPWAHCDFREWTTGKYTHSFNVMGQLVKDIGLTNREENRILGELNTWATNGQNFMSGTTLGLEIVGEIRQQTHVLSRYVQTLCTETDSQFIRVQKELSNLVNSLEEHEERLKSLESIAKENKETIKDVKNRVEDHIPQHIRAHHGQEIREWEQDQTTFFETRATRHILKSLPSHNCIIVTGSSGCGKSSNIHHAALHLRDSLEYEIIPVLTGPSDIMNYYNRNKKQVFVVDDICGKETINTQTLQMWRDYSEKLGKIFRVAETDVRSISDGTVSKISNPRLLISCRLHINKESQFQRIALFTKKVFNLLSPELCLLEAERIHMLHKYVPDDIIDNIKQVKENFDYFPLLCKLSKDKTCEEVEKLFTAPLDSIKTDIITIIDTNKEQFCALVLCIVFNDGFDTDWLKLGSVSEKEKKDKLEHIVKEFDIDLSKERHINSLKAGFSTLHGTYFKLRGTEYRMIHDKIHEMAAVICGQHLTECFMKYATPEFIQDHFILESLTEIQEKDDLIVLLKDQEEDYFERLLCDLTKHVITSTFNNAQLISQTFRDKLLSFLRKSDVKTVLKSFDTESCIIDNNYDELEYRDQKKHFNTTPLIESATTGYFDIVEFLIVNVKCNVNNADERGNSPLHKASERGHTAVAKLLLENNADVSQCNIYKDSPLYAACAGGHKDTVELLLQNNADVNQCNTYGTPPLCVACTGGHKDTVELLLQNNADVNQCNTYGTPPLCVACTGGHTDTVELLLQNNADVSQCNTFGMSPLYMACEGGHTETVDLLFQNKADVNQCDWNGRSPLYVACEIGHKDIVELLLQKKAEINLCHENGESPLYLACKRRHTDIVELLLQNNADVNRCNENGKSPLYGACEGIYTRLPEVLLRYNKDVSGHSLFLSFEAHTIETKGIVEMLLQTKADVNQCDKDGCSPLFAACRTGQKETVELLLQEKADVNQCNSKGESPLHAVCSYHYHLQSLYSKDRVEPVLKRYIETVKILLAWNADVKMFNRNDHTPLDIARESHFVELVNLFEENLQLKESQLK